MHNCRITRLLCNSRDKITYRELNEKDSAFGIDSAKLSPAAKELKRNDLIALYQKVQGWNQDHATEDSAKITGFN